MLDLPRPEPGEGVLRGEVVRIDRFGNVVTNLDRRSCERLINGSRAINLTIAGHSIARIVSTFPEVAEGELGALLDRPITWKSPPTPPAPPNNWVWSWGAGRAAARLRHALRRFLCDPHTTG
jgi:hypothetical protein